MNKTIEEMIKIIEDRKIEVLVTKDVREMSTFAEYFIIAIADNERQLNGIATEFQQMKSPDVFIEGRGADGWIAIQYREVCAHIFTMQEHEIYRLDKLYAEQPTITE